ncbi:serine hydrolase [Loigolactobacillus binensis]|uniref:Serine hydrolase n=1 Tax=Loigolactobacillus binensis TaxID=2559922 RepID=A0ABW3EG94_9LACO|nr:serine hydrolase [Loigolactobacillus binensis]
MLKKLLKAFNLPVDPLYNSAIMNEFNRYALKKILIVALLLFEVVIVSAHLISIKHPADPPMPAENAKLLNKSSQIKRRQKTIKQNLTAYLKTVTKDKTVSVSFYNLGAQLNSPAANSEYADVYREGALQVEANANTPEVSASTYKLFITAYLMAQKSKGNFAWTNLTEDGFYRMIVNSENDFAEQELVHYSLAAINQFIKHQNWYAPVFSNNRAATTTSHSLQLLLEDLAKGQGAFTNHADRKKILKLMGEQKYRTGIPTGVAAATAKTTVADKVGFLNDTNNDAGIVTLPNGQRYILVIMTHGHKQSGLSGFPRIAKIAKQVQTIVYGEQ